jgi:hypothetical protein
MPKPVLEPARVSTRAILRTEVCPTGLNVCHSATLPLDQWLAGS